jgi:sulfoquinovose isomerase
VLDLAAESDRLLDFAERARHPAGGFAWLDESGTPDLTRPRELLITARMTHCFALAHLLGRSGAAELAEHGVAALTDVFRDRAHGGWVPAEGQTDKRAYEHAFVVLAASSAVAAGLAADGLLAEALDVLETRFWDAAAGALVDVWDREWRTLEPYRGANANMHGVEAMLAAADALHDDAAALAARLRGQALRATERVVHGWAPEHDWRLPEHFTAGWTPQPDFNRDRPADPFRPYGITVGHQFEWSRLALHVRAVTADPPGWLLDDARALFDAAAERGWAADGREGFPYTLDWDDRPVVGARMHWVLAEAVAAAGALAHVTADQRYRDLARQWRDYGERAFADPATGSWHHELTATGEVGSDTWAGQPDAYHLAQMLLLDRRPVRGSVAAALR